MRIFPVSKNARFTHDMTNFGLIVRGKRFSTHEAVFLIIRFPDYTYRVSPPDPGFPGNRPPDPKQVQWYEYYGFYVEPILPHGIDTTNPRRMNLRGFRVVPPRIELGTQGFSVLCSTN